MVKKKYRSVHGVLLLDKSAGVSSYQALAQVKRYFQAEKAGHTGTLDPFATGLLPLCFGEATKFSHDLLHADKTYEATVHLGIKTNTGDIEGEVIATHDVVLDDQAIERALAQFRGGITQIPPMYSALKREGKPLYEYARAGQVIERSARNITIYLLEKIAYQAPYLTLRVRCSKGTYIRVLGEDIGAVLGCGGHLSALRRTAVDTLDISQAVTLDELICREVDDATVRWLAPVDTLLASCPSIHLPSALAQRFMHGQRIALEKEGVLSYELQERVRVYDESNNQFLGTAHIKEWQVLAPERLIRSS